MKYPYDSATMQIHLDGPSSIVEYDTGTADNAYLGETPTATSCIAAGDIYTDEEIYRHNEPNLPCPLASFLVTRLGVLYLFAGLGA